MNMKTLPSQETLEVEQLRVMLDDAREKVNAITEASKSLGEMVDLMAGMFHAIEEKAGDGPVDERGTDNHYRLIHEDM